MIAGRYRVDGDLGTGGMARVVTARDDVLHRRVAIKLLPAGGVDAAARERFRREARSAARFVHPNVVTTFDAGEDDGQLYIVMELVDGESLAASLARRGPLPVADALRITDALLAALGAAHDAGIVHRDVKPANVLLGRNGSVKLADFGIARRLDDLVAGLTAAGTFLGTATYAAPEQLGGQPATAASDLYSTGVVLYELLTGEPPYRGGSAIDVARAHQTAPVPDVAAVRPDVPPSVASVVTTAMAKEPSQRFASAPSMRDALSVRTTPYGRAVRPIATPPPPARRSQVWWWVTVAALVVTGVVAIAIARRDQGADEGAPALPGPSTTAAAAPAVTTTAPTTTLPATTLPGTTVGPVPAPAEPSPATVADLVAALETTPDLYGPRSDDLRRALEKIDGSGRDDIGRAVRLLDQVAAWEDAGELDAAARPVVEQVLGPLLADERDDQDEG